MTPYELRFEIFKQATLIATDQFHADFAISGERNSLSPGTASYPSFPSYEDIEVIATKINAFVGRN